MIYVGNDIVEVKRIKNAVKARGDKFLNHIYTQSEQEYCLSCARPEIHFAGRFSAKEAIKKALLSSRLIDTISLNCIEIIRLDDGAPTVELLNIEVQQKYQMTVSISHTDEYATAVALLEM
jgi:holo-[acyl-carrier protein] synthase